jgi:hypothetical protein
MKRLIFSFLIVLFGSFLYAAEPDSVFISSSSTPIDRGTCTCKGIPLHGNVKIVESAADFDVRVVTSLSDIDVKVVESLPNNCGEWRFVESLPDFTVRFVESGADFDIRFVESLPGVR